MFIVLIYDLFLLSQHGRMSFAKKSVAAVKKQNSMKEDDRFALKAGIQNRISKKSQVKSKDSKSNKEIIKDSSKR